MGEQAVQGAEDRGKTSKRGLQDLRNQYMQQGADNGLSLEDLSQTFNLSEEWIQNGILRGPCRKREKNESPLNRLEINSLKLDFAGLMNQQGYTLEQCNYMLGLTSEGELDRQQRQTEQDKKYRDLEVKHEKLRAKAEKVLGNLQKQITDKDKQLEGLSKDKADLQKQLSDKDKQMETGNAKLQELEELRKQYDLKCTELESSQEEHTKILKDLEAQHKIEIDSKDAEIEDYKQQIEHLKQQIVEDKQLYQENYQKVKTGSQAIINNRQAECDKFFKGEQEKLEDMQKQVHLAEDRVKLLEAENESLSQELLNLQEAQVSSGTGTGKKKLTGVQEEQILSFYKKRKYKVTDLSVKKLERECGIVLTKKAIYNLFDRFGIQR